MNNIGENPSIIDGGVVDGNVDIKGDLSLEGDLDMKNNDILNCNTLNYNNLNPPVGGGGGINYNGSIPVDIGRHCKYSSTDATTINESNLYEDLTEIKFQKDQPVLKLQSETNTITSEAKISFAASDGKEQMIIYDDAKGNFIITNTRDGGIISIDNEITFNTDLIFDTLKNIRNVSTVFARQIYNSLNRGIRIAEDGNVGEISLNGSKYFGIGGLMSISFDGRLDVRPDPVTDNNRVARFDGTSGQLQNSGVSIDDLDIMSGLKGLTTTGDITFDNGIFRTQNGGSVQIQHIGSVQIQNIGTCQIQPTGNLTLKGFQLTGDIIASGFSIKGLAEPIDPSDAVTKNYVDSKNTNGGLYFTTNLNDVDISNSSNIYSSSIAQLEIQTLKEGSYDGQCITVSSLRTNAVANQAQILIRNEFSVINPGEKQIFTFTANDYILSPNLTGFLTYSTLFGGYWTFTISQDITFQPFKINTDLGSATNEFKDLYLSSNGVANISNILPTNDLTVFGGIYIAQRPVLSSGFVLTGSSTIANSIVETDLIGGSSIGVGSLISAGNSAKNGTSSKISLSGSFDNAGAGVANDIIIRIKLGIQTINTFTIDTDAVNANSPWIIEAHYTINQIGVIGNIKSSCNFTYQDNSARKGQMINISTQLIDTTQPLDLSVTGQWNSASVNNTITVDQFISTLVYQPI